MALIHLCQTVYPACQASNLTSNTKGGDLIPAVPGPPIVGCAPASPGVVLARSIEIIR